MDISFCALAAPGGPWHLTFAPWRLENHTFFMQILYWAPCMDSTSSGDCRDRPLQFSQDQFQIENQLSLVNFLFIFPHTCNFNFSYNGVLVLAGEK